jgi:hypothetical protein
MFNTGFRVTVFALSGMTLSVGAANSQVIADTSSYYGVSWYNGAFSDAGWYYVGKYDFAASAPFSALDYSLSLPSNAQNLSYSEHGGTTISPLTAPSPPYSSPETIVISDDGSSGGWGWYYAAGAGIGQPISYGKLGDLSTLNFELDGNETSGQTIGYSVEVVLPGDWATPGTETGNYILNGVAEGFSTPTFMYEGGLTVVSTQDLGYLGNGAIPILSFTLIGQPIPEPSTWAMMLIGFAGLGFLGWRGSQKTAGRAA